MKNVIADSEDESSDWDNWPSIAKQSDAPDKRHTEQPTAARASKKRQNYESETGLSSRSGSDAKRQKIAKSKHGSVDNGDGSDESFLEMSWLDGQSDEMVAVACNEYRTDEATTNRPVSDRAGTPNGSPPAHVLQWHKGLTKSNGNQSLDDHSTNPIAESEDIPQPAPTTMDLLQTVPATDSILGAWQTTGSMRDQFFNHEPMTLFPDQPSTVSNGTLTQQQLYGDHRIEATNNAGTLGDRRVSDSTSFPWSSYIKSPTLPSQQQASTAGSIGGNAGNDRESVGLVLTSQADNHNLDSAIWGSMNQGGSQNGSVLVNTPTLGDFEPEVSPPNGDRFQSNILPTQAKASQDMDVPGHSATEPFEKKNEIDGPTAHASDSSYGDIPSDELIGLPKELYNPRPSRSRSSKVSKESIDFSVRPENAKREKSRKKARSLGHLISPKQHDSDHMDGAVEETGPRSASSGPGHKSRFAADHEEGAAQQRAYVEITHKRKPSQQTEQLEGPKRKRGKTRKTKSAPMLPSSELMVSEPNPNQLNSSEAKVEDSAAKDEEAIDVQEKATTENGTGEKSEAQAILQQPPPVDVQSPKKRGRGRAKKPAETGHVQVHRDLDLPPEGANIQEEATAANDQALREKTPNIAHHDPETNEEKSTSPEKKSEPGKANVAHTLEKGTKPSDRLAQSPLGKSKVPYRVGLSRRARITPLLRVVRK